MSYEDRIIPLLTYLRTDFRSPRSITFRTSEPEHGPENKSAGIVRLNRRLKHIWHLILIGILSGILVVVVVIIIIEWNTKENAVTSLEQIKKEMKTNTEKLLEEKSRIAEQLKLANANYSILLAKYDELLRTISCNLTIEKDIDSMNEKLTNTLKAQEQLEGEIKQMTADIKSTQINHQLKLLENEKQRSFMSMDHLDFIWDFCNQTNFECSYCVPGWVHHAGRCFLISNVDIKWENARTECLNYKGDLALVLNAKDQEFLTKLAFRYKIANPNSTFHSAWIGLQDLVKEGVYVWVNGEGIKSDVTYWIPGEPNNNIAPWDIEQNGQDCVSIVPPDDVGPPGWMDTWDDITCVGKRHYICELEALI